MFLWAKLMLHHIQQQVTLDDLEAAVDELPDGLDTVYARILAKMSALPAPQARSVARVLQWAFSARRPLSLAELEVALAVKPGAGTARLNKRSRAMNIRQLIADFCGPLLEVDPRTSTVRFTHVSALQYLQTLSEQQDESNLPYDPVRFPLMLTKKAPHLAATCLTYLAYSDIDFVTADSSPDVYAARLDQHLHTYKFLRYAALNLWTHFPDGFSFSSGSADPDLTRALDFFFADEKNMVKWLQLYQLLGELATPRSSSSSSRSAFHPQAPRFAGLRQRYAGFRRLGPTASGLFVRWDRWKSEDSFNGNHCSPLTVAAFFDFAAVVRQLLSQMSTKSQGAADAVDNGIVFGYTPFLHAVHGDAADTAALLLAARADPARATTAGYCAARYASRNCIGVLPAILRLDVPWLARQDYEGRTVLHAVCSSPGWDPAVVNSFLGLCSTETARQHLDTQDTLGLTVLHHAANIDVAQSAALMWDRLSHSSDGGSGAERRVVLVSLQEAFTPTTDASIQTWARNWHVFFQGTGEEAPPLDLASLQNLVQRIKVYMLRELVTRRSDVNIADHQGRTTLHICAATHSQQQQHNAGDVTKQLVAKNQCIEALLAGGADPFLRDGVGQLPVDMAIAEGDWPAARLLCGAMQTRLVGAGRPESDCDRTEELQALLLAETTANSDRPRSAPQSPSLSSLSETDWMVVPGSSSSSSSSSFPRTFGDVVKATLILRSCLKLVTGAGDDTSAKLAQRILDAAGYYSVQARAAVDIRSWRPQQDDQDTPRVSLTLALDSRVAVRRIDVFIASERLRPRNYYADSDGRVGSDDGAEKRHEDGGGYYYHYRRTKSNVVLRITSAAWRPSSARSRVGPRRVDSGVSVGDRPETASALSVSSHNTWDTVRGDDSRAASLRSVELDRNTETLLEDIVNGDNDGDESPWYHDSQAFLRVEVASASTPATDKEGKNTPTPPPPPVPRITNLGVLVDRQRNVDIWRHTWPAPRRLPSEENATDTRPRPAHASGLDDGQTREWLASLKHGDTVTLAAAEGFFVQDIARFAKFGLVVYCGLRL
ncbi:hypothetical protein B0T26DRAFT_703460 [Lasiosphaeria miniovina]|uniref:Ankyrin repeat protein n=1 Tax=Lasiosphaeria miniovina TaxID=1954250 RepID=A0AA40AV67_9PEZI|nr:uncharacterized protein B0T26DRAFT_703460 [Lasiosphaeria miniovina]KAK0722623.1 hypothetical protein B0T26DRAFT_703460 [Lasiosphaeria miniovina]